MGHCHHACATMEKVATVQQTAKVADFITFRTIEFYKFHLEITADYMMVTNRLDFEWMFFLSPFLLQCLIAFRDSFVAELRECQHE